MGNGLFVYNASTLAYQSSWVGKDHQPIYSLLHIPSTKKILAFTCDGIECFDVNIQNNTQIFDQMEGNLVFKIADGQVLNLGVAVSPDSSSEPSQIWVCAHTDTKIFILDSNSFELLNTIDYTRRDMIYLLAEPTSAKESFILTTNTIASDLQVVQVGSYQKVVLASNWLIVLWDAKQKMMQDSYDCWKYCDTHCESDITGMF